MSLLSQKAMPAELIVIDNNSTDETPRLVAALKKSTRWTIRYVKETGQGYPVIYNRGLAEAKTDWVAFIDDDCIADQDWLQTVSQSIKKYPQAAAILGKSGTVYTDNVWSMTQLAIDSIWKAHSISGSKVLNYKVLDNKNIIYNKRFLKNHALSYDTRRATFANGSSEDCDLGLQLQAAGGQATYVPKLYVLHHDMTDGMSFFRRLVARSWGYMAFQIKWSSFYEHNGTHKNPTVSTWQKLEEMRQDYNLSWLFFFQLVVLFLSAMFVSYLFKIPEYALIVRQKYGST
jgi:glycosyltransferase involved in cell wall biosynthesis